MPGTHCFWNSDSRVLVILFYTTVAAFCGYVCLKHYALSPLVWLVLYLAFHADSRIVRSSYMLSYYLGIGFYIIYGSRTFFDDSSVFMGIGLWVTVSLLNTLPYLLFYSKKRYLNCFCFTLAVVSGMIPFYSIAGWGHPLFSIGALFPGSGIISVFILFGLCLSLTNNYVFGSFIISGLLYSNFVFSLPVDHPARFHSVSTSYRLSSSRITDSEKIGRWYDLFDAVNGKAREPVIFHFPETITGRWSNTQSRFWTDKSQALGDNSLLFGTEIGYRNNRYENVMMLVTNESQKVIYRQRVPVPISMWRPWSDEPRVSANWFESSVVVIDDNRVAFSICYESLLAFPFLLDMINNPDYLVVSSNQWWARDGHIPIQHHSTAVLQARLIGGILSYSKNL